MKVDFHSGVTDKVGAACRFLRKAQAAGATVIVSADRSLLDRLDMALWTFDPLSFVSHVRVKAGAEVPSPLARSKTWLVDRLDAAPAGEVLLNLGPEMADGWERFDRVVEIVSADADDAQAGRSRWRRYGQHPGVERVHHERGAES